MRLSVMPLQRMQMMVATMLSAVPMLPMPLSKMRERPVVGAVAGREELRGQRRVGEPAHIGRGARAVQAARRREAEVEQQAAEGR